MLPQTKLDIAKFAVRLAVALKTSQICHDQIEQHTELDADSIPVQVGCYVTGHLVAGQVAPYTDAAVERTYNFISSKFSKPTVTAVK